MIPLLKGKTNTGSLLSCLVTLILCSPLILSYSFSMLLLLSTKSCMFYVSYQPEYGMRRLWCLTNAVSKWTKTTDFWHDRAPAIALVVQQIKLFSCYMYISECWYAYIVAGGNLSILWKSILFC